MATQHTGAKDGGLLAVSWGQMLCAKEIAAEFGMHENTVYRWLHEVPPTGRDIPREYVRRRGFPDYLFHPAVLDYIRSEMASLD